MHDGIELFTFCDGSKTFTTISDVAVYFASLVTVFSVCSVRVINDSINEDEDDSVIFDIKKFGVAVDVFKLLKNKTINFFTIYSDGLISIHVFG